MYGYFRACGLNRRMTQLCCMISKRLSVFRAVHGHVETVLPFLFRKTQLPEKQNFVIPLEDGDVVHAVFWPGQNQRIAILTHGLEGSADASYIRVLARHLLDSGSSVLAWNFRGCGGSMNRLKRLYHSGAYGDLRDVIAFASQQFSPEYIQLYGFSLGGNLTLVAAARLDKTWFQAHGVRQATVISPPMDLAASARKLSRWWNTAYSINFLIDLKAKIRKKAAQFPGEITLENLSNSKSIIRFDDFYTAPMHGFANAADYYRRCSSRFMLEAISVPTRIILSENDPMLARGFLNSMQIDNPLVTLEMYPTGGHCGFWGKEELWVTG